MKKLTLIVAILFVANNFFSQDVSVTVYNDNLGVVKEHRIINVDKGKTKFLIKDIPTSIDPTSVHIKFNGKILEQNYKYDLANRSAILSKYIDKSISLNDVNNQAIQGTLISLGGNDLVLRRKDGGLLMISDLKNYRINVPELPKGFVTKPTLEYLAVANSSGKQNIELSYFTHGMKWEAEYVAVLSDDDKTMKLNSWVSITNNSGKTFKNAKVKLVAGNPNFANENPHPVYGIAKQKMYDNAEVSERSFFEYHIYELPLKTTLANNETKQIAFLNSSEVNVEKKFILNLFADNQYHNADVKIVFENKKDNSLGMPLPKGKVRVFKKDNESLEFIGEDLINHTAKGETVNLTIGKAFDVKGKLIELSREKISDRVYESQNQITVMNAKDKSVKVQIPITFYGDWKILSSDLDYKKINSRSIVFTLNVKPNTKTSFKYSVRIKQ